MEKKSKIIIGIGIVLFGIIGMLIQPYLLLAISSLFCIPGGASLIIYAVS